MARRREPLLDLRDWIKAQAEQVQERIDGFWCDKRSPLEPEHQKHHSMLHRLKGNMEQLIFAIEMDHG